MSSEFPVVFALYPRITQLDFTGPLEVMARMPGASVVLAASRWFRRHGDPGYLAALRRLGSQARYIISVCTGSLLLGAAGLLRGSGRGGAARH